MAPHLPQVQHLWQEPSCGNQGSHVLIFMHGRGGSMHDFEDLCAAWKIPHLCYLLLNAPDPFFGGWSWYDLPPSPLPGILRSRALLEEVLQALNEAGFPPSHVFLSGFSQGHCMTLEFGMRYPQTLAGYIGICGQAFDLWECLHESSQGAKKGDWLWSAGSEDEHFSIETCRTQAQRMQSHGFDVDFQQYPKGHEIHYQKELPYIRRWILDRM